MSSDTGLLLIRESTVKIGLVKFIYRLFHTNDTATFRIHTDPEGGCADELTVDPIFTAILGKEALASRSTIFQFFNHE